MLLQQQKILLLNFSVIFFRKFWIPINSDKNGISIAVVEYCISYYHDSFLEKKGGFSYMKWNTNRSFDEICFDVYIRLSQVKVRIVLLAKNRDKVRSRRVRAYIGAINRKNKTFLHYLKYQRGGGGSTWSKFKISKST